jgi:hypothetical protein
MPMDFEKDDDAKQELMSPYTVEKSIFAGGILQLRH